MKAKFIAPMLLQRTERLPEGEGWLYELKLDGYRAIAFRSGKVHLRSRNDNDFAPRYPGVVEALQALPNDTVIDGEIVALDEAGKPSFNVLQNYGSGTSPVIYYVFDLLVLGGRDLRGLPLAERRKLLEERVLPKLSEPIRQSPVLDAPLDALIRSVEQHCLEGLIAKRRDSAYQSGQRSADWLKMRINQSQEFVIGGYTMGGWTFDALIFGYYDEDRLMYAARTRNGFTPALRQELMRRFKGLGRRECPFANLPEKRAGR